MLKKTINYTDYNGNERTEDFYFNLTEAEILEMEMSQTGGLAESIQRIVQAQDIPAIIKVFKDLVLRAYGVKSPDGKRFIKNDSLREDFEQTEAYSKLFMELYKNPYKASELINKIVPVHISEKVNAIQDQNGSKLPS